MSENANPEIDHRYWTSAPDEIIQNRLRDHDARDREGERDTGRAERQPGRERDNHKDRKDNARLETVCSSTRTVKDPGGNVGQRKEQSRNGQARENGRHAPPAGSKKNACQRVRQRKQQSGDREYSQRDGFIRSEKCSPIPRRLVLQPG